MPRTQTPQSSQEEPIEWDRFVQFDKSDVDSLPSLHIPNPHTPPQEPIDLNEADDVIASDSEAS